MTEKNDSAMSDDSHPAGAISRRRVLQALATTGVLTGMGATAPVATASSGDEQWKLGTGGQIRSVTMMDGTIYAGSNGNPANVYAVDASSGDPLWRFEIGSSIDVNAITGADGTVYASLSNDKLYAINASSGDQLWEFEGDDAVLSSPAIKDGTIYVGSGNLYAIDASTGDQIWEFEPPGFDSSTYTSSTVVDDTVYITNNAELYAVEASTGNRLWTFDTGIFEASPTVVDDIVYIGSYGGVEAVDASTGTQLWQFGEGREGVDVVTSPTVFDGTVYVGGLDSYVYAIDASTGNQLWRFGTEDAVVASPTVTADTVYVGSGGGGVLGTGTSLYAIDACSGDQLWRFKTGDDVVCSPAVGAGTVYVGSDNSNLYAIEANRTTGSDSGVRFQPVAPTIPLDGTRTVRIVGDAPLGVSSFRVSVSVADTSSVQITGLSVLGDAGTTSVNVADDGSSATGAGIGDGRSGTDLPLLAVTLRGESLSSSSLSVTIEDMADADGNDYAYACQETVAEVSEDLPGVDVTGDGALSQDVDGDGLHEDIDGDGDFDTSDVQAMLDDLVSDSDVTDSSSLFDFSGDGSVGTSDVQALLDELVGR